MGGESAWTDPRLWDLFDLSAMVAGEQDAYLATTLLRCVDWFEAAGGSFFLFDVESQRFVLRAKTGIANHLPLDTTIELGQGIAGIVAQAGRPKIVHDPRVDPELVIAEVEHRSAIGSSMVIPLLGTSRRAIGILNLARDAGSPAFQESDLDHALTLANHVALALTNARVVEALRTEVEARKVTNERLVAVLDSVAGAVVVVDADGQVLNHNQAAMRDSFLADQPGSDLSAVQESLRSTTQRALTDRQIANDRAYDAANDRTWLIQAVPLASGGAVVTVQEVTDHERNQREVARVRRLAEIGQMTAAIAHEIRNPLTGIRSAAQMIRTHPETAAEFASVVEEEAIKLNQLCDEFLDFARPLRVDLSPVRLADLVQRTMLLAQPLAEEKGVNLTGDFTFDDPTIEVDRARIEQVVLNLIQNAIQATPAGGMVRVLVQKGSVVVEDSGIGMSAEELGHLFSPFYTTKPSGTGLGLCNVRKILDAHGATISVQSEPGQGSRFEVNLKQSAA